ncbi:MAG: antirepressor regulating drug resistance protein, partial [Chthonomonadales bacterium]|nr:antirepressor regulating drug resistance protein [Chthonomonadales bacterium]
TVVLLCAGLIVRLLSRRASAATRGLILFCTICALLLLPMVSQFAPAWSVAVMPSPQLSAFRTTEMLPNLPSIQNTPATPGIPSAAGQSSPAAPVSAAITPVSSPYRVSILLCLWAVGAVGYGFWLILGRLRLLTLASRCPVVSEGPLVEKVRELALQIGMHASVKVRQAHSDPSGGITPMTWGWLRPTLLLPTDVLETWPEERTRAVLLHELAHIARRDWLAQTITQCVCALYWFNPLVWRTASVWERESELACDDRVILAGIAAPDYAAHLLEVVRALRTLPPVVVQGSAHAMAAPRSNVQTRLMAILAERQNRRQTSRATRLSVLALGSLFLLPIAALRLTSQAQAEPTVKATMAGKTDPDIVLMHATERSWRGEWATAAKMAGQVLLVQNLSDSTRGSAYWLLFEAAWWQGDKAAEDRNYALYKEIAAKHPDDQGLQVDLLTAERYRSGPNPKTYSPTKLIEVLDYLIKNNAYADALHYSKYLLSRPDMPAEIRVKAILAGYRGAHYWKYADSVATLEKQFHEEATRLPEATRQPLEADFAAAKKEKTQEERRADGPVNLNFSLGLAGWANDNPQHDAENLYETGIDPKGRRAGQPSAFLASKGGNPSHYGTIMQNFTWPGVKGKRIRYSAYMKTQGAPQGAGLWIVLFGAKNNNHGWNMTASPIRGTNDWKKVEWVFDVPKDNVGFSCGIDLTGDGKVWVDDIHFDIVDKNTPVSPESE